MAQESKIEWLRPKRSDGTIMPGHTLNLWHGCTKVHEGCDHCYAETQSHRWGNDLWGNDKPRKMITNTAQALQRFQKLAENAGEVHRVFVGSMMDIFEKPMPMINHRLEPILNNTGDFRWALFAEIDFGYYPNLDFLFLTKRPSNINKYIPEHWKQSPPANVMFGASPVTQAHFDHMTSQLAQVNGRKFLSIEPQLSAIKLRNIEGIDWIIQGGESGHHKRPFNLDWAVSMRDECAALGIPYFFKQIDKVQAIPSLLQVRQFPHQPKIK